MIDCYVITIRIFCTTISRSVTMLYTTIYSSRRKWLWESLYTRRQDYDSSMRPIFIASVGNPGSTYAHTLHSAGHTLLGALVSYIGAGALTVSKAITGTKGRYATSDGGRVAFWESPNYMNDSGPDLATAWRKWSSGQRAGESSTGKPLEPRLIVVHDELELPCGRFSIKTNSGASARGHNGLKSFLSMPHMKQLEFTRIGVGIGPRPLSRDPDDVARYVLAKMSGEQRAQIEGIAAEVWEQIDRIREGEEPNLQQKIKQQQKKEKKERGRSHPPNERVEEIEAEARASSV